jgi:hypothetical protein
MMTFASAKLVGRSSLKLVSSQTSDGRKLSLILEGAECRDRGDSKSRHAALSFDIEVELKGQPTEPLRLDLRGAEQHSAANGFAVLRLQAAGTVFRFTATTDGGAIDGRAEVRPVGQTLRLSVLLLVQAGELPADESLLALDTIDLSWTADA